MAKLGVNIEMIGLILLKKQLLVVRQSRKKNIANFGISTYKTGSIETIIILGNFHRHSKSNQIKSTREKLFSNQFSVKSHYFENPLFYAHRAYFFMCKRMSPFSRTYSLIQMKSGAHTMVGKTTLIDLYTHTYIFMYNIRMDGTYQISF